MREELEDFTKSMITIEALERYLEERREDVNRFAFLGLVSIHVCGVGSLKTIKFWVRLPWVWDTTKTSAEKSKQTVTNGRHL